MAGTANAVFEVARKEVLQHLRTKRLLGISIAFVVTITLMTIIVPMVFLGGDIGDQFDRGDAPLENFVLLFYLQGLPILFFLSGYFYIQLLALLLTADGVSSEWSHKTIFLLLSKPVSRGAMLAGKFLGSAVAVGATVLLVLTLDYLALVALLPGSPDAEALGRFLLGVGLVLLGVLAYAAIGLLCSTLTQSTVAGILLAVTAWIIIFPLLGNLDSLVALARFGAESFSMSDAEAGRGWSQYLSPGESMRHASEVFVGTETGLFGDQRGSPWAAALALIAQTAVFLGLSFVVVRRRNFE